MIFNIPIADIIIGLIGLALVAVFFIAVFRRKKNGCSHCGNNGCAGCPHKENCGGSCKNIKTNTKLK